VAAKLAFRYGAGNVAVLDSAEVEFVIKMLSIRLILGIKSSFQKHYYQPMFTLVAGGMKSLEDCSRPMADVLSPLVTWVKDKAAKFEPQSNRVITQDGTTIEYDHMVVATGLQLDYGKIPGLVEALAIPKGAVCSNYSPQYVNRVYETLQNFRGGNAIFTFPSSPVKCPGAPQKICYITDHFLRKNKRRGGAKIYYNSSLPVIFGVKHYADALWKVVKERDINVNLRTNLIEVLPGGKQAVFENLDTQEKTTVDVSRRLLK
jgi:eukaryotic sulfide quinone oxidoreductase